MAIPGLSVSMPSSATSKAGDIAYRGSQETTAGGSAGNRGFVNNFAAEGGQVSAPADINGPALVPGNWGTWAMIGLVGLVAWLWWRRKKG